MKTSVRILAVLFAMAWAYAQGADPMAVSQAIKDAKASQSKADSLQGGWVTTDKLIKQAETAAKKGESDRALELAKKAKREAELAYAQAKEERDHWSPPPYLLP